MVGQVFIGSRVAGMDGPDRWKGSASGTTVFSVGGWVGPTGSDVGEMPWAFAAAGLGNGAKPPSSGPVPVPLLRRERMCARQIARRWRGAGTTIVPASQLASGKEKCRRESWRGKNNECGFSTYAGPGRQALHCRCSFKIRAP